MKSGVDDSYLHDAADCDDGFMPIGFFVEMDAEVWGEVDELETCPPRVAYRGLLSDLIDEMPCHDIYVKVDGRWTLMPR